MSLVDSPTKPAITEQEVLDFALALNELEHVPTCENPNGCSRPAEWVASSPCCHIETIACGKCKAEADEALAAAALAHVIYECLNCGTCPATFAWRKL